MARTKVVPQIPDGEYRLDRAVSDLGAKRGDVLLVDNENEAVPLVLTRTVERSPRRFLTALPAGVERTDEGDNPVVFRVSRAVRALAARPGDQLHLYRDDLEKPVELYRAFRTKTLRRVSIPRVCAALAPYAGTEA